MFMNIVVKAQKTSATPALKEYALKKFQKLSVYFEHIQDMTIDLKITRDTDTQGTHLASVIAKVSKGVLKAEARSVDMYASLDTLYLKIQNQLKKHKEKMKANKVGTGKLELPQKKLKTAKPVEKELHYIQKPMDPEDALLHLLDQKLPFLVFKNMKEKVCVVYPTSKKEYGLIQID